MSTWIKRLFGSGTAAGAQRDGGPCAPGGVRVYAVGDVHGRLDLLDELLAQIAADSAASPDRRHVLVMLGDLIDRGPESAGVVDRLTRIPKGIDEMVLLCGNHEEALIELIDGDSSNLAFWLRYGGHETLLSYGIDEADIDRGGDTLARAFAQAVPRSHIQLYRDLVDHHVAGDYAFVHAGIKPGVPLDRQRRRDLRWIREPFLEDGRDHGHVIVHGHTITDDVDMRPNRIGIDTGAYRSGVLTALVLDGAARMVMQTGAVIA
ncbi:MAG: hypothetical protein RLZZ58_530 [Pseudomonadota bacterium]